MSAFKWLAFALGIPLTAGLLAVMYEFVNPAIDIMHQYSTSETSATGIQWYEQFISLMPLVVLLLLAFMLVVGIVVRRRSVPR